MLLFTAHGVLLALSAARTSPTLDEVGHLPAGLCAWQLGRFDLYRVNPPLIKLVAAAPVWLDEPVLDWRSYSDAPGARPEWSIGADFVRANGQRSFWYFTLARWACIPFSLVAGYVCYRWARELYGPLSGLLALSLWCFSPTVIGWAATVNPDAGAAAMGVLAAYCFWRWLHARTWGRAAVAGLTLGLAQLTKSTWLVLIPLWALIWLFCRARAADVHWRREAMQGAGILLLAVYVLNLGYGFEGTGRRLGDFVFVSRILTGHDDVEDKTLAGNRFAAGRLRNLPVPLPASYIAGIDLQKRDFEQKDWSYLNGEWRLGGWWYYYLYALVLKEPLGTWLLGLIALGVTLTKRAYSAGWRNELVLLLPAAAVLVLVSSQTGFSRYLRYVLPCFPFAYIWISKVARSVELKQRGVAVAAACALAWSVVSSLLIYPHSLSYFNELAGGPRRGHRYLIDANIDWGQDLLDLRQWYLDHPDVRPVRAAVYSMLQLEHFGIDVAGAPVTSPESPFDPAQHTTAQLERLGPQPGWQILSVHRLHDRDGSYDYFLRELEPVERLGYSIYIYHVSVDDANRVRRGMGLPELTSNR
jgi:hypothetical protein